MSTEFSVEQVEELSAFTATYESVRTGNTFTCNLPVKWSEVIEGFYGTDYTYEDYKRSDIYLRYYDTPFHPEAVQDLDTDEMNKLAILYEGTPPEERGVFVYRMTLGLSKHRQDVHAAFYHTQRAIVLVDCANIEVLGFELFKMMEGIEDGMLKRYGSYIDFETYALERMKRKEVIQIDETTWIFVPAKKKAVTFYGSVMNKIFDLFN